MKLKRNTWGNNWGRKYPAKPPVASDKLLRMARAIPDKRCHPLTFNQKLLIRQLHHKGKTPHEIYEEVNPNVHFKTFRMKVKRDMGIDWFGQHKSPKPIEIFNSLSYKPKVVNKVTLGSDDIIGRGVSSVFRNGVRYV